jgi:hypothetical protein
VLRKCFRYQKFQEKNLKNLKISDIFEISRKKTRKLRNIEFLIDFNDFCGFGNVLIWKSTKNAEKWAIGRQKIRRYVRERALTNFQNLKNLSILRMVWNMQRDRQVDAADLRARKEGPAEIPRRGFLPSLNRKCPEKWASNIPKRDLSPDAAMKISKNN